MTDNHTHKLPASHRRPAQKRLSASDDTAGKAGSEAHCIRLEKKILELQTSLIELHRTKQRLEKQVDEKTVQLLQKNQQYHHCRNELIIFAKHTVERVERDRRKVSDELHDNVAQGFATIKLFLENKLALMGKDEDPSSFSIESILEITRDNLNEIRRIINYLRPKMLDDIGLLATIQWHWQEFQSRSPDITLKIKLAETEADIPEKLKLIIYRIIQEASNNIERHSRATSVEFKLRREDQSLKLKIRDNGNGFDLEALQSNLSRNPGLTSIKEYTELSNGRFSLRTSPKKGTYIEATWDLENR